MTNWLTLEWTIKVTQKWSKISLLSYLGQCQGCGHWEVQCRWLGSVLGGASTSCWWERMCRETNHKTRWTGRLRQSRTEAHCRPLNKRTHWKRNTDEMYALFFLWVRPAVLDPHSTCGQANIHQNKSYWKRNKDQIYSNIKMNHLQNDINLLEVFLVWGRSILSHTIKLGNLVLTWWFDLTSKMKSS